jgi:flagellar hook protein FlgE
VWVSFLSATKTDSANNSVASGAAELDITFTLDDGSTKQIQTTGGQAGNSVAQNGNRYVSAINAQTSVTGISASYDVVNEKINLVNANSNPAASHNINLSAVGNANSGLTVTNLATSHGTETTAYQYRYDPTSAINVVNGPKTFTTIADLRYSMETQARAVDVNGDGTLSNNIEIIVNEQGKFQIKNLGGTADDYDMNLKITALTLNGVTENTRFTTNLVAMNAVLPVGSGGTAYSQSFNAATHSSSIDIFESLGSKHTLRSEFRKTAVDTLTGSTWNMKLTVPQPATIDTIAPYDEKTGSIRFNNDGSIATYNPPNISFSANNGSSPDQQVNLSFGTANTFDGMTSFDSSSATSGISQDGFTGGDLIGIRIDQSGTLVGSFSNGRSFGLAQIGMAKFTNNEGLTTEGGNVYVQTANSGDPIIGTAATAGRGFIQSSALEASNVDLSRALTQLIIIQRGFQANGKTITTSDQLLQTLIGLKN